LDGGWFEKRRLGGVKGRFPVAELKGVKVDTQTRRKGIVFGAKEEHVRAIFDFGAWVSIDVEGERRGELEDFVAAVEKAASG
jgi:hypothetical protein